MCGKNKITDLYRRIKQDYSFRTFLFSALSFLATAAFTGYNLFLYASYGYDWNFVIAVYYALLLTIKAYVLVSEVRFYKGGTDETEKEKKRKKKFLVQSIFLFIIDFALIAPLSFMTKQKKPVRYTTVSAIAVAAYTFYKLTVAAYNAVKTRNKYNLSVNILRKINFIDALVSLLALQYTLIMTFGELKGNMFKLCAVSSFAVWAAIVVVSLLSVVKAVIINRK